MTSLIERRFLNQQVLYGSRIQRVTREFLVNSGVFWLFNTVYKVSANGLVMHLTYLPQWVLLGASIVQAFIISRNERHFRWWYPFIAPALYTMIDVWIEGLTDFFAETYHLFYWVWAGAMTATYLLRHYGTVSVFMKSLLLVILLPAMYLFAEIDAGLQLTSGAALVDYWFGSDAHFFILFGSLALGAILGITTVMRERFEKLLYNLASHFEQIASWSFDEQLIQEAYANEVALDLQRVERTVMFMDIRGFTSWSETHTPREVVDLVNAFYRTAEPIIKAHNGFKIQMTGDEVMTRFYAPQDALRTALTLQPAIAATLTPLGLSAGIGIHTGEVVEGLVGGDQTKQYSLFGDTVNTAARLQGQAKDYEVILSMAVWNRVEHTQQNRFECREVTLKGKSSPMRVMVIPPLPAAR